MEPKKRRVHKDRSRVFELISKVVAVATQQQRAPAQPAQRREQTKWWERIARVYLVVGILAGLAGIAMLYVVLRPQKPHQIPIDQTVKTDGSEDPRANQPVNASGGGKESPMVSTSETRRDLVVSSPDQPNLQRTHQEPKIQVTVVFRPESPKLANSQNPTPDAGPKDRSRAEGGLTTSQPQQDDIHTDKARSAPTTPSVAIPEVPPFSPPLERAPAMPKPPRSTGVVQGWAIVKPTPRYPLYAKSARISGDVVVEIEIDEAGKVVSAKSRGGSRFLVDEAVSTARLWRFKPTLLSGNPVPVKGTITFHFNLE